MKYLILLVLLMSLAQALEAEYHCPEQISVQEEFSCTIQLHDGKGTYDTKIELKKEEQTAAKIWNEEKQAWQSAYYYLKEKIKDDNKETIKLIILYEGTYQGLIKIRQGTTINTYQLDITAKKEENTITEEEKTKEENTKEKTKEQRTLQKETIIEQETITKKPETTITLNQKMSTPTTTTKKTTNHYLPIGILIFILLVCSFYLWEKL